MSKKKKDNRSLITRVVCIILAALMVLSAVVIVVQMLSYSSYAATYYYSKDDTSKTNPLISVGLRYGSACTVGYKIKCSAGIDVGSIDANRNYTSLWTFDNTSVTAVLEGGNLGLDSSNNFYFTSTESHSVVGMYHIQVTTYGSLSETYSAIKAKYSSWNPYIAYIDGAYYVRVGQFSNLAETKQAAEKIHELGYAVSPVSSESDTIGIVDSSTNKLIFEFRKRGYTLGVKSRKSGAYLVNSSNYSYDGCFSISKSTGSTTGLQVCSIVPLETYVMGVIPYEVSASSHIETLKTFAVAARSFGLASRKHDGFDLCSSTCCQMYCGMGQVNDNVRKAVEKTAGLVVKYNGKITTVTYSSSTGGSTVGAAQAWGSTGHGYLSGIQTPWESYDGAPYGNWTRELSPKQIKNTLYAQGYTVGSGTITKATITTAPNSTYVYSITFTDSNGFKTTVTGSDKIRLMFGLKSANFDIGKVGEKIKQKIFKFSGGSASGVAALVQRLHGTYVKPLDKISYITTTKWVTKTVEHQSDIYVLSNGNNDIPTVTVFNSLVYVITGKGVVSNSNIHNMAVLSNEETKPIALDEKIKTYTVEQVEETVEEEVHEAVEDPDTIIVKEKEITLTGTTGNFVFCGRGYGHGVGLSQYGVYALASYGVEYQDILKIYLKGITIAKFK